MRKNVILWDLCHMEIWLGELRRFQSGKVQAAVALYTRQYNKLVNGCQWKVGLESDFDRDFREETGRIYHRGRRGHRVPKRIGSQTRALFFVRMQTRVPL